MTASRFRVDAMDCPERSALALALAINACFFVGELTAGLVSRSVGLVADGLDMAPTPRSMH